MLPDKIPEKFCQRDSVLGMLVFALTSRISLNKGEFSAYVASGEIYSCSQEKILKTGDCSLKRESQWKEDFLCPKIVVPVG